MGNKFFRIVTIFAADVVFDLPQFIDDFISHLQVPP